MNYPLKNFAAFWKFDTRQVGLAIKCPNCGEEFMAFFRNPIGGGESAKTQGDMWDRTGETLETLSLTPSFRAVGHYHSWIKNGELQVDSAFSCEKKN